MNNSILFSIFVKSFMKHKGSQCDFSAHRDADLLRAYKQIISVRDNISYSEIIARLAKSPSSQFWVSEKRAYDVVGNLLKGRPIDHMNPTRKAMFLEIFHRFKVYREQHPSLTRKEILWRVLSSEAPSFYLTPKSIEVMLNRVRGEEKRRCLERRKRILQFMSGTL